jgi:adenylate kinase family enzyme
MISNRIAIVGTSGSGKSTLAENICRHCGHKNIELDALYWKPDWQGSSTEELAAKLNREISECEKYVIHGNYSSIRDLVWNNIDAVIWLNYRKSIVMWRVIKRTLKRVITREKLWNGNVETVKGSFFAKDAIIIWAWNTYAKRKEQYERLTRTNPYEIEKIIVLNSLAETKRWTMKNVVNSSGK